MLQQDHITSKATELSVTSWVPLVTEKYGSNSAGVLKTTPSHPLKTQRCQTLFVNLLNTLK